MTGIRILLGLICWVAWADAREIDNLGRLDE